MAFVFRSEDGSKTGKTADGGDILSLIHIFSGGNDPLVIIDGVFGDLNMLNAISPADIESFTVLKDASETAQYLSLIHI